MRTPELELSGFKFLVSRNPRRYEIKTLSFLDGMVTHYKLYDKTERCFVGNELGHFIPEDRWEFINGAKHET